VVARATAAPARTAVERPGTDDLVLTQLLSIARLTPAQAVALGSDVLAGLEDAADLAQPRPRGMRVGRDGRARVTDTGSPPSGNRADLASAAALLDGLRAATWPSATDAGLVSALERAATEARAPHGLASAAAILREADAAGGAQARAEIARLVTMVADGVAPAPTTGAAPPAPTVRRSRPPRAVARSVVRRSWKWVLSLVVLVVAVLVEIAFLRDEIGRDVQAVLEAGRAGPAAETSAPTLPPVVPPAPAAAGPISRVELRPVGPCTPDATCALRMQILLRPQAEPQTITWEFRVIDRCTGAEVTVPGGTVTVPPHGVRADVVGTVGLPRTEALAVLAMTSSPFSAASTAVGIPANGVCGS
jgi:hypothetical protein